MLALPVPDLLPSSWSQLTAALLTADLSTSTLDTFATSQGRSALVKRMGQLLDRPPSPAADQARAVISPLSTVAESEQAEHDRYFNVTRRRDDAGVSFVAGVVVAYAAAYENCRRMGVTLLDEAEWERFLGGLRALAAIADGGAHVDAAWLPVPTGQPGGYDPKLRWLVGHQLFFALIQGAIVGLNCFAAAGSSGLRRDADRGLTLAAAFMRSSAAAMRFASDFEPSDYDATVRPSMAPPAVRDGFSGLQTRDHAHLVRLFAALKPVLAAAVASDARRDFVDSVISAYASHEFICARFRGDVLPSLRMAAHSRGKSQRSGVEVIGDMMRARLALIDPSPGSNG